MLMFNLDLLTPQKKTAQCCYPNWILFGHQYAADSELVWLIHPTPTTELEDQQDSILPAIATALVPIHSMAWKTA